MQVKQDREMYNSSIKEQFLKTYEDDTAEVLRYAFSKSAKLAENHLDKDLYNFNDVELDKLLRGLGSSSYQSISSYVSYYRKYIDWAIDNNMVYTNINLLRQPKFYRDELKKYIAKGYLENKYITEEDLNMILDIFCLNDQDKAMYILPWNGALGSEACELRNLKISDIDKDKKQIIVHDDDGNSRIIQVNQKTIDILIGAYYEKEYNVYTDNANTRYSVRKYVDTDYILKKTVTRDDLDRMKYQGFMRRFNVIAKAAYNEYLTPTNVWMSGIFHYAQEIKNKNGELTDKDYDEIMQRFGTPKTYSYKIALIKKIKNNTI